MPRSMRADLPLTSQQQVAVDAYLAGDTMVDAYSKAGFFVGKARKTAHNQASQFFKLPRIVAYIARIREMAAAELGINKQWVLAKLLEVHDDQAAMVAFDTGAKDNPVAYRMADPSGARETLKLIGKELGMFVDRRVETHINRAAELSDDELAEIVRSSKPNGSGNGIAGPSGGPTKH